MSQPYLSFIIAGRNDGYGGDLDRRFDSFLRHLHGRLGDGHDLFEIVVCDWNPPAPERTMRAGFCWSAFSSVRFITVPPAAHESCAGESGYPILDYIARNVAIRRSRGKFICVFNQDIYLSTGIADAFRDRRLDAARFYRADRCDFAADFGLPTAELDRRLPETAFQLHRRHIDRLTPITVRLDGAPDPAAWPGSRPLAIEAVTAQDGLALAPDHPPPLSPDPENPVLSTLGQLGLHTNAAGDFLVAPRAAFEAIQGFVETNAFYLHLDTYAVVQLHAAGYRQALFLVPDVIYHADHDRSGRAGRREGVSGVAHGARWLDILSGRSDFRLNGPDWGLADQVLPVTELQHGRPVPGSS